VFYSKYEFEVESAESQELLEMALMDVFFNRLGDRKDITVCITEPQNVLFPEEGINKLFVDQISKASYSECESLFWENIRKGVKIEKGSVERNLLKAKNELILDRIDELNQR
jgi:hypothetical protein